MDIPSANLRQQKLLQQLQLLEHKQKQKRQHQVKTMTELGPILWRYFQQQITLCWFLSILIGCSKISTNNSALKWV